MLAYEFEIIFISYLIAAFGGSFLLFKKHRGQWILGRILPIFLLLSAFGLIEAGYIEPNLLTVRQETFESGRLRQEIKVAVLSDWHLRPGKNLRFVNRVADRLRKLKPDAVFIAGDFLFHDDFVRYADDLTGLSALPAIAPTYAVLGNHDYGIGNASLTMLYNDQHEAIAKALTVAGIKVLRDKNIKVKINGEDIQIAGFDELWLLGGQRENTVQGLDPKIFTIGLSHDPDASALPFSQKIDILLSGHTHGGQVRLPYFGALGYAQTALPKTDYGAFLKNQRPALLNTSGLGESGPHLRFFNLPEIVILNIK